MPATVPSHASKHWCFTLNNYTAGEEQLLADVLESDHVSYGIYGRETGESGTPHLQGYVVFAQRKRLAGVKALLGVRYHLERTRGTPKEASDYCKKEDDFNEYGTCPGSTNSKAGKWEQLTEWVESLEERPSEPDLYRKFPGLMGPQRRGVLALVDALFKQPSRQVGSPRDGWQRELESELDGEPDERTIHFLVDGDGNSGKSWFAKYYRNLHPEKTQILRVGKRDDMAHSVESRRSVFFFDVPRLAMEYLQYVVLESIKDGVLFSPKYDSQTKYFEHKSHVVVMCNERPDMTKLSHDRFKITIISEPVTGTETQNDLLDN